MRLLGIVLVILLLIPTLAGAQEGHWAMPAVESLTQWKIAPSQGYDDLDRSMLSSEWNLVVSRALGLVPGDDGVGGSLRNTVALHTQGAQNTDTLSRSTAFGGLMQILRVYGVVDYQDNLKEDPLFSDWQEIPEEYQGLLAMAVRDGLITGYPGGRFFPEKTISVAEALTFLHRALERYRFLERIPVPNQSVASSQETTEDGIRVVVYTDRAWYLKQDTVSIIAGAENRGTSALSYTKWKVGDPPIYVWAEVGSRRLFLEEEGLSPIRLPAVTSEKLLPGRAVIQRLVWDLGNTNDLEPGIYPLIVSFYPLRSSENPATPDLVRVRLELEVRAPE